MNFNTNDNDYNYMSSDEIAYNINRKTVSFRLSIKNCFVQIY